MLDGVIWGIILILILSNGTGNNSDKNTVASSSECLDYASSQGTVQAVPRYSNGKYLVNKDIDPGIYRVILKDSFLKMGYVERAKDITMDFDNIIANIAITGNGYVEIKNTDVAVKLQGVEIYPIDIEQLVPNVQTEVSDGIYLVGYDVQPGNYKVEVTDQIMKIGYVERARNVAMGFDAIIANNIINGPGYVKILPSDFAVKVSGAKLIFQE